MKSKVERREEKSKVAWVARDYCYHFEFQSGEKTGIENPRQCHALHQTSSDVFYLL